MEIVNLDQNVLDALSFFANNPPPKFDTGRFHLPFVVGSGNAYNTGLIIFSEKAAIFADESNFRKIIPSFKEVLKNKLITQCVVLSASGGKDSVWEIELAKQYGLKTTLLTTKRESPAAKLANEILVYRSVDEPYTYNVSTYMGMILSATGEDPLNIERYIKTLEFPEKFSDYNAYSFVLPDKYVAICPMLDIKKSELFGPKLSLRAFSQGHARHAKFVIRDKDELVITIGSENRYFGMPESRWDIMPPNDFNFAGIMALTYFIVGKIQISKPPYFKTNIQNYVSDYGPKAYGMRTAAFEVIVPGSSD